MLKIAKELNCNHSKYIPDFFLVLHILKQILGLGNINSTFFLQDTSIGIYLTVNSKLIYTRWKSWHISHLFFREGFLCSSHGIQSIFQSFHPVLYKQNAAKLASRKWSIVIRGERQFAYLGILSSCD